MKVKSRERRKLEARSRHSFRLYSSRLSSLENKKKIPPRSRKASRETNPHILTTWNSSIFFEDSFSFPSHRQTRFFPLRNLISLIKWVEGAFFSRSGCTSRLRFYSLIQLGHFPSKSHDPFKDSLLELETGRPPKRCRDADDRIKNGLWGPKCPAGRI